MQLRTKWCPHVECIFIETFQDSMCIGRLPKKVEHDKDFNTHRWCLKGVLPMHEIFDLQINKTDAFWFNLLFKIVRDGNE